MAKKKSSDHSKRAPPSKGRAFIVGLLLFGMILCPAGMFLFFNIRLWEKVELTVITTMAMGCVAGLAIAVIPAIIFMHWTMKKIKY